MGSSTISSGANIGSSISSILGSTSLATCISNEKPNRSGATSLSSLAGDSIGDINVRKSGTTGVFSISSPYSVSSQTTYDVINFNRSDGGSLTATATATYPHYVHGWYSLANGGGTQIVAGSTSTSSLSINLSSNMALYDFVYAHIGQVTGGASLTSVNVNTGNTAAQACNGESFIYYTNGAAGSFMTRALYTNSAGTTHASAGWYSNNPEVGYYNGSGGWSNEQLCVF